ncbi:MAG: 2-C-methyl-D-erythritol 4-phosphate cytidylyltransferase [Candidatus Aminicenantales bacterium]
MKRTSVIIVAAGEGKRFGSLKQFSLLKGKPVLDWTLDKFEHHERIEEIVLVLKNAEQKKRQYLKYTKISGIVEGGEKRQDSVMNGFDVVSLGKAEIVLVHDAVRPLVTKDIISGVIEVASEKGAAIPVLPVDDTVKQVSEGKVMRTIMRRNLFRVQTPQGFSYTLLRKALKKAKEAGFYGTDEASLVERIGGKVYTVEGSRWNLKITTLEDLEVAEALIEG